MATKKEVKKHLEIALKEVGKIKPWFDEEVQAWIFSHSKYPVRYAGDSKEEVIKNYPLYLQEFIEERLKRNLSPLVEKRTKGKGGKREGAGRPKGTAKEKKIRIYLPEDVASWMKHPGVIPEVRKLMAKSKR
ncbi:MAG: hypothetical protein K940chlam9_00505 [Chlamydiae bacterium]|nr:hypothetical protein [Chlamydiota bacterium]